MKDSHASQFSGDTRIDCRELNGQFVLQLPARPRRVLKHIGGLFVLFVFLSGFFLVVGFYLLDGFLPVVLVLGTLGIVIFLAILTLIAAPYLKSTFVLLTKDRAVVKTVQYGKEEIRQYALDGKSRARQWYSPRARSRRSTPDLSGPQGIEIGSERYNPEVDDIDLNDETKPRFGEGLPRGELDWVQWRINRFLDNTATEDVVQATPASVPVRKEGVPEKTVARPQNTLVRIIEDPFQSRVVFPNTVENRSFSGIRGVMLGLGLLTYPLFVLLRWTSQRDGGSHPELFTLVALAVVSLLALAELLKGLTRLFGRRKLVITPEAITYRPTLFGIGLPLRLPTAEVVSVGAPRRGRWRATTKNVAPAQGSVIRTADRELNYSEALRGLPEKDKQWIIGEVAWRINAARSGKLSSWEDLAKHLPHNR